MAKVSVSIPDEVVAAAKAAGLNISRCATNALLDELDRQRKIAELGEYLEQLDAELGPIGPEEAAEAARWAERFDDPVVATRDTRSAGGTRRTA